MGGSDFVNTVSEGVMMQSARSTTRAILQIVVYHVTEENDTIITPQEKPDIFCYSKHSANTQSVLSLLTLLVSCFV